MTFFFSWKNTLALFSVLALLVSCGKSNNPSDIDAEKKFVGIWSSDVDYDGLKNNIITSLAPDGTFHEVEKIFNENKSVEEVRHAGDWSFDGVNLKRRYTRKNGKPLTNAQFGYITFAVREYQSGSFIGVNNIEQRSVKFTRINAESHP